MSRMLAERKRFQTSSSSTLASSSEPGGCYDELIKYASHIGRKVRRRLQRFARRVARNHRRRRVTPERAAVAVSLRRRHRRRHASRTRRRADTEHHQDQPASQSLTAVSPPSPARRSPCSPQRSRADDRHRTSRSSPEPAPPQRPVAHVLPQPGSDQPYPLPHAHPTQQQQQREAARRPDFLSMPSHDSVGYASIVSVLSWSSLPTPSVNLSTQPVGAPPPPPPGTGDCRQESADSDSVTATRYLVLPLELISISPQSRRASSASAYLQDFCCLSSEQLIVEHHPNVSAVDRVRRAMLRSESLGGEPRHPTAAATASSRHRFVHRASSFTEEMPRPSHKSVVQPADVTLDEAQPYTAEPSASDSASSTAVNRLPDSSPATSSVRRNSVNRASSLSSATTPRTTPNLLAVPAPVIGSGARRASVIRARSLGNDPAFDIQLAIPHTPHSVAVPDISQTTKSPVLVPPRTDVACRFPACPPVTVGDGAERSSAPVPEKSTFSGVNSMSRTTKDVAKVTSSTQRVGVGRASSFTIADHTQHRQRSATSSKLIHQTSALLPRSLKTSSDDCVYHHSPSMAATQQGLHCILPLFGVSHGEEFNFKTDWMPQTVL